MQLLNQSSHCRPAAIIWYSHGLVLRCLMLGASKATCSDPWLEVRGDESGIASTMQSHQFFQNVAIVGGMQWHMISKC